MSFVGLGKKDVAINVSSLFRVYLATVLHEIGKPTFRNSLHTKIIT